MSKVAMPRPRYIAFAIDGARPAARGEVQQALRALPGSPQLTRYAWPHGIVRVEHGHEAACRAALARVQRVGDQAATVRPLSTSGTLLALTTRLGVLQERPR